MFVASRPTTVEEVNDAFRQEAATARYEGILGVSEDPLVSADIVGDPRAAVVDLELTTGRRRHAGQGDGLVRQRMGLHPPDDPRGPQHPRRARDPDDACRAPARPALKAQLERRRGRAAEVSVCSGATISTEPKPNQPSVTALPTRAPRHGRAIECDLVVVGVGAKPNGKLAAGNGVTDSDISPSASDAMAIEYERGGSSW